MTNNTSATTLLLQDLINAPSKAESLLECLTADQIIMIEDTINRVKRRKMDKSQLPSPVASPPTQSTDITETTSSAAAIANALAAAMVSAALQVPTSTPVKAYPSAATITPSKTVNNTTSSVTSNDPIAEVKDGVEWVSFVYSHNRTLKRYSIRTDIQQVALDAVDDKFKAENCVSLDWIAEKEKILMSFFFISGISPCQPS